MTLAKKRACGAVAVLALLVGCGASGRSLDGARPSEAAATAPVPPSPPPPPATAPEAPPPADLPERLLRDDGSKVSVASDASGRVGTITFRSTPRRAMADGVPLDEHVRNWFARYGVHLGYGELGDATVTADSRADRPGLAEVRATFPQAVRCAGLLAVTEFVVERDGATLLGLPRKITLVCPGELRAGGVDPLRAALLVEGYPDPELSRGKENVKVSLQDPRKGAGTLRDPGESRVDLAKRLAERLRDALDMPVPTLDAIDVVDEYVHPGYKKPNVVKTVTFGQKNPPRTSECIDFQLTFDFEREYQCAPAKTCRWFLHGIQASCPREPKDGAAPPADDARPLPAAANRKAEFLGECESLSFAWGYQHAGVVIDRKGDVYRYSGGPPLSGPVHTADALFRKFRYGRRYVQTLSPAEVDLHASLIPAAARAPVKKTRRAIYDAPSVACYVFAPVGDGKLRAIPLEETSGTEASVREGEAARKLTEWLGRAAAQP
jgi:hypothetical protein